MKPGEKYMWFPIRIKWRPDTAIHFFDWHAVQNRGNEFFHYFHIGPILIRFGDFTGHYVDDGSGVAHWEPIKK